MPTKKSNKQWMERTGFFETMGLTPEETNPNNKSAVGRDYPLSESPTPTSEPDYRPKGKVAELIQTIRGGRAENMRAKAELTRARREGRADIIRAKRGN